MVVTVNNKKYNVELTDQGALVEGVFLEWNMVSIEDRIYHLIRDSKSYLIEVLSVDQNSKSFQLKVNNVPYTIEVQDKYDLILEKLGMNQSNNSSHMEVRAPMPGLILEVLVEEGQQVNKGDKLIVLEAMKMENVIRSSGSGVVGAVNIAEGANVEKNQVLIQF